MLFWDSLLKAEINNCKVEAVSSYLGICLANPGGGKVSSIYVSKGWFCSRDGQFSLYARENIDTKTKTVLLWIFADKLHNCKYNFSRNWVIETRLVSQHYNIITQFTIHNPSKTHSLPIGSTSHICYIGVRLTDALTGVEGATCGSLVPCAQIGAKTELALPPAVFKGCRH